MLDDQTLSYWRATAAAPERAPLTADATVGVAVIGAGIAGLSTAYSLARAGMSVCVIDDGAIGGGMTERTSAHLSNAIDDRYHAIERRHGKGGARICAESHGAAIEHIADTVAREGIDCAFTRVDGYLFEAPNGEGQLERERDAARRAGLKDVDWVERAPIAGFNTGRCLRFPRQAQFHPLRYLNGLARAVERHGGRIHCGTAVTAVDEGPPIVVETASGAKVRADAVVVATNSPINDRFAMHTKQAPYTTYIVAGPVAHESVAPALYWDTSDPYHYVRLAEATGDSQRVLIVGGEDHKTGQSNGGGDRFAALERWARERFTTLGKITHRWSGQVLEPADGVAFIGRNPGSRDNVFIATGDSGMGLTHGTIAGILLSELIAGRPAPWSALYDPSRKMLKAPLEYAKENLNVAARFLEDHAGPGDVRSVDDVPRGAGAIVRQGLSHVAAYRDTDGTLTELSAVCPHLGCIVSWNDVEHTWDCPCHGSRFDRFGKVVSGPANRDLGRSPRKRSA